MAQDGSDQGPFAPNPNFDPFSQSFTLLLPDGKTPFKAELFAIQALVTSTVHQAIIQSVQLGLGAMLFLVLLLMTKSDKRRSLVFIINASALLLVVLRGIFGLAILVGPYYNFYRWITHWYVDLGNATTVSVAGEVFAIALTFAIELALVLQVRIVCCTLPAIQRLAVNGVNIFVAFIACAFHFTVGVLNIHWTILGAKNETKAQFYTVSHMAEATYIAITVSIGLSSLIFTTKLAFAIKRRRSIGMTRFVPMQIIFIMGCQTMIIPFIFTIISYFAVPDVGIQTFVQTSVAILLPLSAMWASASTNNATAAYAQHPANRVVPVGYGPAHKTCDSARGYSDGTNSTLTSTYGEKMAMKAQSKYDLEMQNLNGVQVERTYSVRSSQL